MKSKSNSTLSAWKAHADIGRAHLHTVLIFQVEEKDTSQLCLSEAACAAGVCNGPQAKVSSRLKLAKVVGRCSCTLLSFNSYDSEVIRSKELEPPSHYMEVIYIGEFSDLISDFEQEMRFRSCLVLASRRT
jgi:hypothetical protein